MDSIVAYAYLGSKLQKWKATKLNGMDKVHFVQRFLDYESLNNALLRWNLNSNRWAMRCSVEQRNMNHWATR